MVLAHVSVRITIKPCTGDDLVFVINDVVVLPDALGEYRVKMPRYEIHKGQGAPAVLMTVPMKQAVDQAVMKAFLAWQRKQLVPQQAAQDVSQQEGAANGAH